jgi:putative transposase
MAWGHVEVSEQRMRFVVAANEGGRTISAVCAAFGISRPTGYEWLKRFQAGGVSAVREQSRRPDVPKQSVRMSRNLTAEAPP